MVGVSQTEAGVRAIANGDNGWPAVEALIKIGGGVFARSYGGSNQNPSFGVWGDSLKADLTGGIGIMGTASDVGIGVMGRAGIDGPDVPNPNVSKVAGVIGRSKKQSGVIGTSNAMVGVYGFPITASVSSATPATLPDPMPAIS